MKPNSDFEKLLKNHLFLSRIINVVIDESRDCLWDDTFWQNLGLDDLQAATK